jgi:D-methionine transport system ATP-binding protein
MIKLTNVTKVYQRVTAVDSINLHIHQGEVYGIIGTSGSGKSTLLRTMNFLEIPTSGRLEIDGIDLSTQTSKQLREIRKSIGMVFQQFNLIKNKTVLQNIVIALKLADYPKSMRLARANECLDFVGLKDFGEAYPAQLSGGQMQRVGIARALATEPKILLCDEPTSALDPTTTEEILAVLQSINNQLGITIVIVSHEMNVIKSLCNRVTVLDKGKVYETVELIPTGVKVGSSDAARFVAALKEDSGNDSTSR